MKKTGLLILLFVILLALMWWLNQDSTPDNKPGIDEISKVQTQNSPQEKPQSEKAFQTRPKNHTNKGCDYDKKKKILFNIRGLWGTFRDEIVQDGIDIRLANLALKQEPPLYSQFTLNFNSLSHPGNSQEIIRHSLSANAIKILIQGGISGLIEKANSGEISLVEVNFPSLLEMTWELRKKSLNPMNNHQFMNDFKLLVDAGYRINNQDYVFASENEFPFEFLPELVVLGPDPESLNGKHRMTPIMKAANLGDGKKVSFWAEHQYLENDQSNGLIIADTLLLNSSKKQFATNWEILKELDIQISEPQTARQLLSRKQWPFTSSMRSELSQIAQHKGLNISLNDNDKILFNDVVERIQKINQIIKDRIKPVQACFDSLDDSLEKFSGRINWMKQQLASGLSEKALLQQLSRKNPFWVDEFRQAKNNGQLKPFFQGHKSELDQALTTADLKLIAPMVGDHPDLPLLRERIKQARGDEIALFLLMKAVNLDEETKDLAKSKIKSIPIQFFQNSGQITPEFLEQQQIDPASLNRTDSKGKNLFYYATKNNNIELMNWLAVHNTQMVSDQFGSDPMDLALKWNTHRETLRTLCELNFPIQQKHREKFQSIAQNDNEESQQILSDCPALGQ